MRPSSPTVPSWIGAFGEQQTHTRKWAPLVVASLIALVLIAMLVASFIGSTVSPGMFR
jgi:hypothetical protein